jgi:hypothetical protein
MPTNGPIAASRRLAKTRRRRWRNRASLESRLNGARVVGSALIPAPPRVITNRTVDRGAEHSQQQGRRSGANLSEAQTRRRGRCVPSRIGVMPPSSSVGLVRLVLIRLVRIATLLAVVAFVVVVGVLVVVILAVIVGAV